MIAASIGFTPSKTAEGNGISHWLPRVLWNAHERADALHCVSRGCCEMSSVTCRLIARNFRRYQLSRTSFPARHPRRFRQSGFRGLP
jgi:hypothetical protein